VHIDQPGPAHIVEEVTLAPVDDQIDAHLLPEPGLVGVPVGDRFFDHFLLGFILEEAVVVHRFLLRQPAAA
jgi:hypothetical protein